MQPHDIEEAMMGFRFQKRIKIMPGVTINASKSGLSTSIGTKGARVTYGHGKRRTTIGLPGTGVSHTTVEREQVTQAEPENGPSTRAGLWIIAVAIVAVIVMASIMQR